MKIPEYAGRPARRRKYRPRCRQGCGAGANQVPHDLRVLRPGGNLTAFRVVLQRPPGEGPQSAEAHNDRARTTGHRGSGIEPGGHSPGSRTTGLEDRHTALPISARTAPFLDPLLRCAAPVVEGDDALR